MLKRLAILGLLLAAAPIVPGQPNKTANQKQEPAKQGQPAVIATNSPDKQATSQTDQAKPSPDAPKWYAPLERSDWWLVLAAFSTIGVICWQSIETRKAAQGAQRAADASLAQIQFMKQKERARLALILRPFNQIEMDDSLGEIEMQIGNFGSTHAFNVRYGAWCEVTKSEEEPFDPYPEDLVGAVGIVRANADPEIIRECIATRIGNEIKANARGLFVHLAGRVEYEDVFGDAHFIRFQYIRRIPRLSDPRKLDGAEVFQIVGLSGWKKCPHPEHNIED